jgi:hypothetical protein
MNAKIDFNIYYRTGKSNIKADIHLKNLALEDKYYLAKPYNIVNIVVLL